MYERLRKRKANSKLQRIRRAALDCVTCSNRLLKLCKAVRKATRATCRRKRSPELPTRPRAPRPLLCSHDGYSMRSMKFSSFTKKFPNGCISRKPILDRNKTRYPLELEEVLVFHSFFPGVNDLLRLAHQVFFVDVPLLRLSNVLKSCQLKQNHVRRQYAP